MLEEIRAVIEQDPAYAYALVFGSQVQGRPRTDSDIDVAIGIVPGTSVSTRDRGDLISRLERAAGRPVDLTVIGEAPSTLAYRIFRDGALVFERDHAVLAADKARSILEYLDFRPVEEMCARGVLAAAAHDR